MRPKLTGLATMAGILLAGVTGVLQAQQPTSIDVTGTWVGTVSDPGSSWYYQLSLMKLGENAYFGLDSFRLERKHNNWPIQEGFNLKQTMTAAFNNNGVLVYANVNNVDQPKFPAVVEQLRLVREGNDDVFVNNNGGQPTRKIYLRRVSTTPVPAVVTIVNNYKAQIAANTIYDTSLEVENVSYTSAENNAVLRYNDQGRMSFTLRNHAGKDINNIQVSTVTAEAVNGLIGFDHLNGNVNVGKNSEHTFNAPVSTNFSVPRDSLHFTLTFTFNGFTIRKQLAVATESYYHTSAVTVPAYTASRMAAVAGYYGFLNTPYADVTKQLDALAAGGDKLATMWRAVFLSMGYGGYKIDENEGYALGRTCIHPLEERARNGDGEALYLMFYACQMGLEGEAAKGMAVNFLEKSAEAGFKPAMYDYALQFTQYRDYGSAFKWLVKSYAAEVKKAAGVIGNMYERGLGVTPDIDSAVHWYKTGMAMGDPDAAVWYAKLVAKGYGNVPPDIHKALGLTEAAATKGCTDAMIFNGEIYLDGKQGVAQNIPVAIKWFKAGADMGDRQAMLALGETYIADAPGFVKDERSGLFWIKKAAELGSPRAMLILANFYNEGTVAEKNTILGRYWYNQAVVCGYAKQDATGINAGAENFMNFWKYADFSPSYIYVNEYGTKVGDSDDGLMNGFMSGLFGAMGEYYGNHQTLIDGLEFVCKKDGYKIYGGTVSSSFVSSLFLHQGQTIHIRAYGVISTGMFSGAANADGLGPNWPEYRIIKDIPCSAVMGAVKDAKWQLIGQNAFYTAPKDGPLVLALNAIDYRNYKGYFDLVVQVPADQ